MWWAAGDGTEESPPGRGPYVVRLAAVLIALDVSSSVQKKPNIRMGTDANDDDGHITNSKNNAGSSYTFGRCLRSLRA